MYRPFSSRVLVSLLVVVGAVFGLLAAVAGAQPRSGGRPAEARASAAQPASQDAAPQDHPCDLTAQRFVDPLIVEEGGEIEVHASYNYRCPEGNRRVHFYLLIENSRDIQREGRTGRQLLENVRDGLAKFVEQIDYGIGSQGGMILFNRTWSERVPLRGDSGGRQALLAAINTFPVGVGVSAASVGGAINEATRKLGEAHEQDVTNVILIVQAGASLAGPDTDIEAACGAAKDAGVVVALLMLDGVTNPLVDCASTNWSRGSPRANGEDIPDTMVELGVAATRGHQAVRIEYCDELTPDFRFVDGSALPRPPDSSALEQYCWVDDAPAPEAGHTVRYRLRAAPNVFNEVVKASAETLVRLTFADATDVEIPFDIPDVCVHQAGRPEFCDPYVATGTPPATATPTPTAPAASPTPTPTADGTAPSDTPVPHATASATERTPTEGTPQPTATATLEAPAAVVYLPVAVRRSGIGSG